MASTHPKLNCQIVKAQNYQNLEAKHFIEKPI